MKSKTLTCTTAMVLLATLAIPVQVKSQDEQDNPPRYSITDLGTFGTFSIAGGLSNDGGVADFSDMPGEHQAFLWRPVQRPTLARWEARKA